MELTRGTTSFHWEACLCNRPYRPNRQWVYRDLDNGFLKLRTTSGLTEVPTLENSSWGIRSPSESEFSARGQKGSQPEPRVLAQPLPHPAPDNSGNTMLREETSEPECSGHETVTFLCVYLILLDSKLSELS